MKNGRLKKWLVSLPIGSLDLRKSIFWNIIYRLDLTKAVDIFHLWLDFAALEEAEQGLAQEALTGGYGAEDVYDGSGDD